MRNVESPERSSLEEGIRAAHASGDLEAAATRALRGYGPEIMGFLVATLGDYARADEAFGQFTTDLWRGLPGFGWRASFRTWAYALARHAGHRVHGDAWQRRAEPLTTGGLARVAAEVRETTARHLRTTMKDHVRALRDQLAPDDRALLVLRVDRRLPWMDIAVVLHGSEIADDPILQRRGAARLRKRFERVTAQLRQLAGDAGLIG